MILDIDEILPLPEEWSGDDSGGPFVLGDAPTTELSHETISKITDQVAEGVLAWQRRPLEALYPVIYLDALVAKVKDGAPCATRPPTSPSAWTWTTSSMCWGFGSQHLRARGFGPGCAPSWPTAASRTCSLPTVSSKAKSPPAGSEPSPNSPWLLPHRFPGCRDRRPYRRRRCPFAGTGEQKSARPKEGRARA